MTGFQGPKSISNQSKLTKHISSAVMVSEPYSILPSYSSRRPG
uniref:Uncharacterized protein n=1 Tax=Anguilla anguilla TaxID=7936 RepID=A0A0E9PUG1_ANGAN